LGATAGLILIGAPAASAGPVPGDLVYTIDAPGGADAAAAQKETIAILRARLAELGLGRARVSISRPAKVRISGFAGRQDIAHVRRLAGARGVFGLYDWEAGLVGRELEIGGFPGQAPPAGPLAEAISEWRAAGRDTTGYPYKALVREGAYPTRAAAAAAVPEGSLVVSEQPENPLGEVIAKGRPGWFALTDPPSLSNGDLVRPAVERLESGAPAITFGFTAAGRRAFESVTAMVARRGREARSGDGGRPELQSGHIAVVVDGRVMTRPIINYAEFPHGIDGRLGALISGLANEAEAEDLAAVLGTSPLPYPLRAVPAGES
jgi:preprotein translocase subunit SecD